MSGSIIYRNPSGERSEVIIEVDPISSDPGIIKTFSVKGNVSDDKGDPIDGTVDAKIVKAFHKTLDNVPDIQLGLSTTINENGEYLIYYTTHDPNNAGNSLPEGVSFADLVVHMYDTDGTTLLDSSSLIINALEVEEVDFTYAPTGYTGQTLIKQVDDLLNPLLDYVPPGQSALKPEIISATSMKILAAKTNIPLPNVRVKVQSKVLEKLFTTNLSSLNDQPLVTVTGQYDLEKAVFGMIKGGIPVDPKDFLNASDNDKRNAILSSVKNGILDASYKEESVLGSIVQDLSKRGVAALFNKLSFIGEDTVSEEQSDFTQLIKDASGGNLNATQALELTNIYLDNRTLQSETYNFWTAIDSIVGIDEEEVLRLRKVITLYGLVKENKELALDLFPLIPSGQSIDYFATYTEAEWVSAVEVAGIPQVTDINPVKQAYASSIMKSVQALFPERKIAFDLNASAPTSDLSKFYQNLIAIDAFSRPNLTGSIDAMIVNHPSLTVGITDIAQTINSAKSYARIAPLLDNSSDSDKINELLTQGFHSGAKIVRIGLAAFVAKAESLGLQEEEAARVYKRAARQLSTAAAVQVMVSNQLGIGMAAVHPPNLDYNQIIEGSDPPETYVQRYPQLVTLFGESASYCECDHCRSSLGPAAYLIDLLEFLKSAENQGIGDPEPVWDQLIERRPEFALLEASCENTNRLVPYIDLVNEVLETAIVPIGDRNLNRQSYQEEKSVMVSPEYMNVLAYENCIHNHTVLESLPGYCRFRPVNIWNEEANAFLTMKGVKRAEIVRAMDRTYRFIGQIGLNEAKVELGLTNVLEQMIGQVLSVSIPDPGETFKLPFESIVSPGFQTKYASGVSDIVVSEVLSEFDITYDTLVEYLSCSFINPENLEVIFPSESCDISLAKVRSGDTYWQWENYVNLFVFHKIKQQIDWTTADLDIAIMSPAIGGGFYQYNPSEATNIESVNTDFYVHIAGIRKLAEKLKLSESQILTWYAGLSDQTYGEALSPFDQIFNNPLNPSRIVQETANLNGNDQAVVRSILGVNKSELDLLKSEVAVETAATKLELAKIKSRVDFARALKISISDYYDLKQLLGGDPSGDPIGISPNNTLDFLAQYKLISRFKLGVKDLSYLLVNASGSTAILEAASPGLQTSIAKVKQRLVDRYKELEIDIAGEYENLNDKERLISQILKSFFSEPVALQSLALIKASTSISEDTTFIENNWVVFGDLQDVIDNLIGTVPVPALQSTIAERYDYVIGLFHELLKVKLDIESLVITTMSDEMDTSFEVMNGLMTYKGNEEGAKSLLELFTTVENVYGVMFDPEDWGGVEMTFELKRAVFLQEKTRIAGHVLLNLVKGAKEISEVWTWANPIKLSLTSLDESFFKLLTAVSLELELATKNFSVVQLIVDDVLSDEQKRTEISNNLGWSALDLATLNDGYDHNTAAWLDKVLPAINLCSLLHCSATNLPDWTGQDLTNLQSKSLVEVVRGTYSAEMWQNEAKVPADALRRMKRDALVNYMLIRDYVFADENALYRHFLLDVEMSSCFMASRIQNAIATVQLWIHRILMGLETEVVIGPTDATEWKWRKNFRVWEAARKVFLYPENWIEPELRDDKSPFFIALEQELLQGEISSETIENAYRNYLNKLEETSYLDIVGLTQDKPNHVLHVFGRTKAAPHKYFHREWHNEVSWTPWTLIDLDIEGDHLIPVVFQNRVIIAWPTFKEVTLESTDTDEPVDPETRMEISLAWSILVHDTWQAKKVSKSTLEGPDVGLMSYYFHTIIKDGILHIDTFCRGSAIGHFLLRDAYRDFKSVNETIVGGIPKALASEGIRVGMTAAVLPKVERGVQEKTALIIDINDVKQVKVDRLLDSVPYGFELTFCPEERMFLEKAPFFMSDGDRNFLINPSDDFVTRDARDISISNNVTADRQTTPANLEQAIKNIVILKFNSNPRLGYFIAARNKKYARRARVRHNGRSVRYTKANEWARYYADKGGVLTWGDVVWSRYWGEISGNAEGVFEDLNNDDALKDLAGIEMKKRYDNAFKALENDFKQPSFTGLRHPDFVEKLTTAAFYASSYDNLQTYFSSVISERSIVSQVKLRKYRFQSFYHKQVGNLLDTLNSKGLDSILNIDSTNAEVITPNNDLYLQRANTGFDFNDTYEPDAFSVYMDQLPTETFDFGIDSPYGHYNWELFFHIPMRIAGELARDQKFEEAQKWYNSIFDPTETNGEAPRRFWKFRPFNEFFEKYNLQELIAILENNSPEFAKQVIEWEKNPFSPHAIARLRLIAYMRNVVMKYLDNLIGWGDQLFRKDTIESITEATNLYVLASEILGQRPIPISPKADNPLTLDQLLNGSNLSLWEEVEADVVQPNGDAEELLVQPARDLINLTGLMLFKTAPNAKYLGYWDQIADRLFKIRHCQNIEGVTRSLALFEPPIDPALLVRAAAAGIDIRSALNDISSATLPIYRFRVLIQKANELCSDVKGLGQSLLSALEKRDAERLSELRASQEVNLLKAIREVKKQSIQEGKRSLEALSNSLTMAEKRMEYYGSREYMNRNEKLQLTKMAKAMKYQLKAQGLQLFATLAAKIPEKTVGTSGVPPGPTIEITSGGKNYYNSIQGAAQVMSALSGFESFGASKAGIRGGYDRRKDEWNQQLDLAKLEAKQASKQIAAAEIRLAILERELVNHDMQLNQSDEVAEFMKSKYTNQELYSWMITQLSNAYHKTYQLAFDVAKMAERAFSYELGKDAPDFIQFNNWDSLRKGLLSGEKLQADLRRMEVAYLEQNKREYEITKHVPLSLLSAEQLLELKETGTCDFLIPEVLYDLDHPGQYMRRIKSVRITVPGVTGPYTNVSAKLTLLSSWTRKNTKISDGYVYEADDERFQKNLGGIQSIATSSGQNDSGTFELNFQDERYLPFEGAGAISNWRLELGNDEFRAFDFNTIPDVILHVSYTARDGGEAFKTAAKEAIQASLDDLKIWLAQSGESLQALFSLKTHFPDALNDLIVSGETSFEVTSEHFPYFLRGESLDLGTVSAQKYENGELTEINGEPTVTDVIGTWQMDNVGNMANVEDVYIVLNYTISNPL